MPELTPFAQKLGLASEGTYNDDEQSYCVEVQADESMTSGRVTHGGFLVTVLDDAAAMLVRHTTGNTRGVTSEIRVVFCAAAWPGEALTVTVKIKDIDADSLELVGRITGPKDRLIACMPSSTWRLRQRSSSATTR